MGCAVGSRLVVHGRWDFPGSAALVCRSFVLRFAGGGLFPAQGWQHPRLLLPSALLWTKSSARILQRGVTTMFWGCFMHLFPGRACSPSPARCVQSGCWKGQVPEEHKRFCLTA